MPVCVQALLRQLEGKAWTGSVARCTQWERSRNKSIRTQKWICQTSRRVEPRDQHTQPTHHRCVPHVALMLKALGEAIVPAPVHATPFNALI